MGSSVGFNHVRKGDVIVKIETGIMKSRVVIAQKTFFSGFGRSVKTGYVLQRPYTAVKVSSGRG